MISNARAVSRDQAVDRWLDAQESEHPEMGKAHALDGEKHQKLHGRLLDWYDQEMQKQAANRYQMALDHDFYDGLQWSDEDAAVVIERGQAPVVYNDIAPTVNWIIGAEKRMKVDWAVLPRAEDDVDMADVKKKVLKYISDVNMVPHKRSEAFGEAVKCGLSWLEDGARSVPGEEPIFSRWESWRFMLYDSTSKELDLSDARYLFRWKYADLDVAEAMFPERKGMLKESAIDANLISGDEDDELWFLGQRVKSDELIGAAGVGRRTFISDSGWVNTRRSRVKLIECWYRIPVECKYFSEGEHQGKEFDPTDAAMVLAKASGDQLYNATKMKLRCAVFTRKGMLQDMPSPYKHTRFPFTPIWCYRRGRDNAPYGMIRNLRDVQESRNKRMSKALFAMSTNQIIGDEDAFKDWNEVREEANRPDGVIAHKRGAKFDIRRDYNEVKGLMEFADYDSQQIQKSGGVTDENLGRETNAKSGIAIERRQDQGAMTTAEIFEHFRLAFQLSGQTQLSLVEQFMSEPKVIRLTGFKGRLEWIKINQPAEMLPDGTMSYLNDITATQADYIVDEQDFTATMRQALFDSMMAMLSKLPPELAIQMLDMVVEMVDFPGKDEMVGRIRKLNGQSDPSKEEDPEAMEREAAQQEAAAAAAAVQMETLQLDNAEKSANIEKIYAEIDALRQGEPVEGDDGSAADERIRVLEEQVRTELNSMQDAFNKTAEDLRRKAEDAAAKRDADIERARLDAGSKEEVARIQADATVEAARMTNAQQSAMQPLLDQLEEVRAEMDEMRIRHEEQEKARKEIEKETKARDAEAAKAERERAKVAEKAEKTEKADKGKDDLAVGQMKDMFASLTSAIESLDKVAATVSAEKEIEIRKENGVVKATVRQKVKTK